ncbi:MAG: HAMP domain-containing sensor histidine kinase, partial [Myxococcota bacterium]|nr:HAMP domain-containing sensor histidine kinase [Myxococcota bacterium]
KGGASIVRLNAALLNYSRGVDEQFADVSIEELIEDTCLVVHGRIRRHRLELKIEPGIVAHCCRGQIERVIGNLLTNASDAIGGEGEDAGEPGIIRISADSVNDDTQIRVVVEDSGPGIPTELTDAVMRPFYTTKSPARGTGLGLYICRGIVKGHKGDLSLGRSASLSGAAVTFTLPVGPLAGHI